MNKLNFYFNSQIMKTNIMKKMNIVFPKYSLKNGKNMLTQLIIN